MRSYLRCAFLYVSLFLGWSVLPSFGILFFSILSFSGECFAAAVTPEDLLRRAETEILSAAKILSDAKIDSKDPGNRAMLSALKKTDKALDLAVEGFHDGDARAFVGLDRASYALMELDTILSAEPKNAKRVAPYMLAASTIIDSVAVDYSQGVFRAEKRPELHLFERDLATRLTEAFLEVQQLMFNVQGSLGEDQVLVPIVARLIEDGKLFPQYVTDARSYVAAISAARRYTARLTGASYFLEQRNLAAWSLLERPFKRLQIAVAEAAEFPGAIDWNRLKAPMKVPKLDRPSILVDRERYATWLRSFEIISNDAAAGYIANGKAVAEAAADEHSASSSANTGDQDQDFATDDEFGKDGKASSDDGDGEEEDADE